MAFQFTIAVLAVLAVSVQAGVIGPIIHSKPVVATVANPAVDAVASTHQNVVRSFGGSISQYSKTVDTPYSSVHKEDTRITNNVYTPAIAKSVTYGVAPASTAASAASAVYTTHQVAHAPVTSSAVYEHHEPAHVYNTHETVHHQPAHVYNTHEIVHQQPAHVYNTHETVHHQPAHVYNTHETVHHQPAHVYNTHETVHHQPAHVYNTHETVHQQPAHIYTTHENVHHEPAHVHATHENLHHDTATYHHEALPTAATTAVYTPTTTVTKTVAYAAPEPTHVYQQNYHHQQAPAVATTTYNHGPDASTYSHNAPGVSAYGTSQTVRYSPAEMVSHMSFDGFGTHWGF